MKNLVVFCFVAAIVVISSCQKIANKQRVAYGRIVGDNTNKPLSNARLKLSTLGTPGDHYTYGKRMEEQIPFSTDDNGNFKVYFAARKGDELFIMPVNEKLAEFYYDNTYWHFDRAGTDMDFDIGEIRVPHL